MKMKTSELEGAALDWAVAESLYLRYDGCNVWELGEIHGEPYSPSTDWSQGGPLIESYRVWLSDLSHNEIGDCGGPWIASVNGGSMFYGPSVLVAACRVIVAEKLGDEVEIPDELTEQ